MRRPRVKTEVKHDCPSCEDWMFAGRGKDYNGDDGSFSKPQYFTLFVWANSGPGAGTDNEE